MAYDRPEEDLTKIVHILKEDRNDDPLRPLANVILEALTLSSADLKSTSVATLVTSLETLLSR